MRKKRDKRPICPFPCPICKDALFGFNPQYLYYFVKLKSKRGR